jgi:hypothetical protein
MPSCPKSTPVPEAQQQLAALAEDLRRADQRLSVLAAGIAIDADNPDAILPAELRAGVEVVRQDLLSDAIETLAGLATLTEDAALKRQGEIADALAWLSAAA